MNREDRCAYRDNDDDDDRDHRSMDAAGMLGGMPGAVAREALRDGVLVGHVCEVVSVQAAPAAMPGVRSVD